MGRNKKKKDKWFVADFETTTEKFYLENGYTKVWLYAICDSEKNIVNKGETIEEFFDYCKENLFDCVVYFHNLKFDGSYLLNYLFKNKYPYLDNISRGKPKGFSTLIGSMGEYYSITVNFKSKQQIVFQDSMKLLPFSVNVIARDFNLPIEKLEIDYNDYTVNEKTLNYVYNDVKIDAYALSTLKQNKLEKMTTASSSFNIYKNSFKNKNYFTQLFVDLDKNFLVDYRLAYRGGRSTVNPIYARKTLENIYRYDINSMYPAIMVQCDMPYGTPIYEVEKGKHKFELYKIHIDFKLKDGHLPSLLKKNSVLNLEGSYYIESDSVIELYISNIDLDLLYRNYDVFYIDYIEIWGFKTTKFLFSDYVNKYYELKNNSKGAEKVVWKLLLNSLYGKFGSKVEGYKKIPIFEDEKLRYNKGEVEEMKHYYLPIAIAITSYAHKLLDDMIHEVGVENFVYCDTDSIHCLVPINDKHVDAKELGKWKLESIEKRGKYVRQKTYIVEDTNKNGESEYHITCCGLPQYLKEYYLENTEEKNIFNDFDIGLKIEGKLKPKQVKGGVILVETTFQII